ncbi:Cytidylate kinase [uncultured archaeon]|nr:Cytidylate kinase [uncultured archaeon]
MVEIICISGLVGSGKDSVADVVAERLKYHRVRLTFKDAAQRMGITLMEYHAYVEKDLTIDKEFDKMQIKEARKTDSILSTWLSGWLVKDAAIRVWLEASSKARAERISKRDGMSKAKALKHVNERDMHNRGRYMALYGVDIYDHSNFDIIINTEKYSVDQIADIVVAAYRSRKR